MGILDSFKNLARPYDENDMFLDDDEIQEDAFPEPEQTTAQAPVNSTMGTQQAAPQNYAPASGAGSAFASQRDNRVVNINTTASLQVVIVKPEKFETAAEIADHLREKRTVVMNLEKTGKDVARRLIDFLSGVAYAQDGKIKRVAVNTYIITPYNVGLAGDIVDELENNGLYL
ncbi:MAG: cell division protein SepF [Candidatus Heteroscillospira sp.]|jgi:cell division inhibitor SepF